MRMMLSMALLTVLAACDDTTGAASGTSADLLPGDDALHSDDDTTSTDDPTALRDDVSCSTGSATQALSALDLAEPGPFEVASQNETFYDTSRPSTDDGLFAEDGRKLATTVWYPSQKEWWELDDTVDGQNLPVVVYSHGFSSSKDEGAFLGEHLASHGYIVVAPTFPLTNMMAPGGPDMIDTVNQPGDVSFLIDQFLAKSALSSDKFHGAVDASRIAVAGTSMGGMTTSLVTYHRTLHDPRVKAAVTLAGPGSMFGPSFYDHRAVPLLALHGDLDAIVDYDYNAVRTLERAAPYTTLVTIEDGSHTAFAPIPLEDLVLPLMGSLVAPEGSHPDNPDRLGCGVIADSMPDDASFLDLIGGAADGLVTADDPMPCDMAYLSEPALEPDAQREIAAIATLAFLESYFAGAQSRRESACLFVESRLGDLGGVTVESSP
ncbi:MAG: dienelactone hydrolase family protein [Proteobacteria bacterium]|nr:dienelactone hydrolase family protein [Pseudomonadota bacterium]